MSGGSNVIIGYNAGAYATGSNEFYLDNQDRTNTAGDKAGALLYGTFSSTVANQTLVVNAKLTASGTTEATTGGAGSLTTAGGIYAAKKIISGNSTFDGAALAISGVNSVTSASGNNSLTLAGTGTGVEIFTLPARLPSYIVSGLPSASTAGAGAMAYVTDSVATAITGLGLAVVGTGSSKVVVVSDGTNWIVQ